MLNLSSQVEHNVPPQIHLFIESLNKPKRPETSKASRNKPKRPETSQNNPQEIAKRTENWGICNFLLASVFQISYPKCPNLDILGQKVSTF